MESLLKISNFAKTLNTTIKTLRTYEEKGILKPIKRDLNGYRYYSKKQRSQFDQIKKLQFFGFSLNEIKKIIHIAPGNKDLTRILSIQKKRLENEQKLLNAKLETINNIINFPNSISQEGLSELEKEVYMKLLSERVKNMNRDELIECTKKIPNEDYLYTVAMVDNEAQEALFSILSDKARKLVKEELKTLNSKFLSHWSK